MANFQIIRDLCEEKKITLRNLANTISISEDGLQKIIQKGSTNSSTLEKIAKVLDVPVGYFFDEEYNNENYNVVADSITKIHKPTKYMEKILETQEITLYDIKAAANLKTMLFDKNQNILGKIRLPNIPKCDGAMYVTGDSMDPIIKSGDIICYKEINDFNNIIYGDMYLVAIDVEGDEYLTIKYITRSDKGDGWICLESFNKRHSPQDFEMNSVTALALVKISIRMNTM